MSNQQTDVQLLQFVFAQHRLSAALKRLVSSALSHDSDISMSEVAVLLTALAKPGIAQKDIAQVFRQSHAAISRQMLQLQDKGYLSIGQHPQDKRLTAIHCTTLGKTKLHQALTTINAQLSQHLQAIDPSLVCQSTHINNLLAQQLEVGFDLEHQPADAQRILEIWLEIQVK